MQKKTLNVPTHGPSLTSFFNSNQAELIYVEQMIPSDGDKGNIYWSGCNFNFDGRYGYAGLQHQINKIINGMPFVYNNICSIWDKVETELSLPTEVQLTYAAPNTHHSHFGGESTGLHTSNPMPWISDYWYSIVLRRWYVQDENITRMAMFIYSYNDNKWTHYISVTIPGRDIYFSGNSCTGFLERFSGDSLGYCGIYGQHFRLGLNGLWEKPNYYMARAGGNPKYWNAELYQGVNIKLIAGGEFDNDLSEIELYPNQFDNKPKPVVSPKVEWMRASYSQKIITVKWRISDNTPPQLTYMLKIHKDDVHGDLIVESSRSVPEKREELLDVDELPMGKYYATLEFLDIFNQKSNFGYVGFNIGKVGQ